METIKENVELRDYLAAKAMQSLIQATMVNETSWFKRILKGLGCKRNYTYSYSLQSITSNAYDIADDMLKQRER